MKKNNKSLGKLISEEQYDRKTFAIIIIIMLFISVWIGSNAKRIDVLGETDVNSIWCGDGWTYLNGESALKGNNYYYMKFKADHNNVLLKKTAERDFNYGEYLCFRTRAKGVTVCCNGQRIFHEEFDSNISMAKGPYMYILYQIPINGIKQGDEIKISLQTTEKYVVMQYFSMGERYDISRYIVKKSMNTLFVCAISFVLVIIIVVMYNVPSLLELPNIKCAMLWLVAFQFLASLWIITDIGCLEMLVKNRALLYWLNCISLMLLPVPFIMYTKYTFFPDSISFDILCMADCIITLIAAATYLMNIMPLTVYFKFIHVLIVVSIIVGVYRISHEKLRPPKAVWIGMLAIFVTAVISIIAYWKQLIFPASYYFGYGFVIYTICMVVWNVQSGIQRRKLREAEERVQLENEKENAELASAQKTRFLSQMSHEIRTPLNAVLGMNSLILKETDNENIHKYAENINSAGKTLLALINDILDLSKIENGKMEIISTDYSLSSVINDVCVMIQERADEKGLEMKLDVNPDIPDLLYGDEVRIKQIMTNFLTNAVKYTKNGWIKLEVCMEIDRSQNSTDIMLKEQDEINLVIRVSDTGIGMKDNELPRLFNDFERLDSINNRSIEGSGLGLSITSQLVRLMDGTIEVKSEYAKGSVFTAKIPQKVVRTTPIGDYSKRFAINENVDISFEECRFNGSRVLVVDDNELNLEVLASILELMELTVDRAISGKEALEMLADTKYDVVMTDDMMPGMSGTELMQRVINDKTNINNKTPFVVITANAIVGAREEYVKTGFSDYMTKPIDIEVLQNILKKYLNSQM